MRLLAVLAACCAILSPVLAQEALETAKKECAELKKEIDAAYAAHREAFAKVRATEEYTSALARYRADQDEDALATLRRLGASVERPDMATWAPRFAVGALKHAGTDAAIPYLEWLSSRGGPELATGAVRSLVLSHSGSPEIGEIAEGIHRMGFAVGRPLARQLATAIINDNENPEIRAWAYFGRGRNYGERSGREIVYSPDEEKARDSDLEMVVELAPESIAALRVLGPDFEKKRLQIGMEAPDIVGTDFDGTEFKLTDYRGKVVVVDFWGDW